MADNPLNAVNRGVYISDNLPFLKSLNDGCIDLVCIAPPFAKNETFGRKNDKSPDPLKPELTPEERRIERDLLLRWGIRNADDAKAWGIDWPETRYHDPRSKDERMPGMSVPTTVLPGCASRWDETGNQQTASGCTGSFM